MKDSSLSAFHCFQKIARCDQKTIENPFSVARAIRLKITIAAERFYLMYRCAFHLFLCIANFPSYLDKREEENLVSSCIFSCHFLIGIPPYIFLKREAHSLNTCCKGGMKISDCSISLCIECARFSYFSYQVTEYLSAGAFIGICR
jgi:hypothetical protein